MQKSKYGSEPIFDSERAASGASHDAQKPVLGYLVMSKLVHVEHPLYASEDGGSYGYAIDAIIRNTYKEDPATLIHELKLEIGEDAAAALRDRCNRGEY